MLGDSFTVTCPYCGKSAEGFIPDGYKYKEREKGRGLCRACKKGFWFWVKLSVEAKKDEDVDREEGVK